MERLLIDLSWASSRMEGNTYSILDTERLLRYGEAATGKDRKEALMILNHKEAIEYVIDSLDEIGITRQDICNQFPDAASQALCGNLHRRHMSLSCKCALESVHYVQSSPKPPSRNVPYVAWFIDAKSEACADVSTGMNRLRGHRTEVISLPAFSAGPLQAVQNGMDHAFTEGDVVSRGTANGPRLRAQWQPCTMYRQSNLTDRLRSNHAGFAAARSADPAEFRQSIMNRIPARRFGSPDEFSAACAFLCSEHAGYITGRNLLLGCGHFPGLL